MLIADLLLPDPRTRPAGADRLLRRQFARPGRRHGPHHRPLARTRSRTSSPRPASSGSPARIVAGELELDGDIFDVLELRDRPAERAARRAVRWFDVREARGHGAAAPAAGAARRGAAARLAAQPSERDAAAISHHYDVSNDFYRLVLGPSMTYSCAVWEDDTDIASTQAQTEQVRADLPQARAAARDAAARRRLRLGRHGACTRPSTTACKRSA